MNTNRLPSEQTLASNSQGRMEDSLPLPSAEPGFPPRARAGSPSPAPEGQSDPASQPKKIRIKLIVNKEARIKPVNKRKPRQKTISKRKPPVKKPPVEKPLVDEKPLASQRKKIRINLIVKKEPLPEEPLVDEKPLPEEPLAQISGNKPPTKIKLKLNPTRKPMINISVPDHVQAMLVDDWENITKNNQLVPLPHPKPVSKIFEDYLAVERPRREEGSSSMDILEEVIAGFREYFEKALSRILLYRFERHQYMDVRKLWDNAEENSQYKNVCDVYGAEHLARLIVSLPELLAQTNMDQQSVSRLREEIGKFTSWLGRNCETYFVNEYETPSQEYIDKARSF
ncbi:hypothetical protein TGAMA5MH_05637 [Trichoderma gamsii]|uniref:Chromatin modification-related protein EAF3 n=1 Tax=Trichoderma gamsii TaxID=398673 RepID=A0A2K0TBJ8_9HYPO|nr:hypothetical protein TGAMA5MH_05637 [Trichoderma gamsii]